jgi:hypothetical protein
MSYNISNTSGSLGIVILDGTINNNTDLTLVGKNYPNYGTAQNENYLYLLENFANTYPPVKPIAGEMWFDITTANLKMNMYDGTNWKSLATAYVTTPGNTSKPSNPTAGDLWYDQTSNQLKVYNGTSYTLVGPPDLSNYVTSTNLATSLTPYLTSSTANATYAPLSSPFFSTLVTVSDVGIAIGTSQIALRLTADSSHNGIIQNPNTNTLSLETSDGLALKLVGQNAIPGSATSTLGSALSPWYNVYANIFTGIATQANTINIGGLQYFPTTAATASTVVIRDSSANINANTFTGNLVGNSTGNAGSSTKWAVPITITLTGAVTGTISVDGSSNVNMDTTTSLSYVPSGLISQWFGTTNNIPSGWQLCDGTNGTPNLTAQNQVVTGGTLYYIIKL